ncbi:hypothetical protein HK096_009066 [Nowakowskiella sp. JEL0078]|nr:hypothetical protein HK096_009066 [Nowakowskiella sp. JEL0078]
MKFLRTLRESNEIFTQIKNNTSKSTIKHSNDYINDFTNVSLSYSRFHKPISKDDFILTSVTRLPKFDDFSTSKLTKSWLDIRNTLQLALSDSQSSLEEDHSLSFSKVMPKKVNKIRQYIMQRVDSNSLNDKTTLTGLRKENRIQRSMFSSTILPNHLSYNSSRVLPICIHETIPSVQMIDVNVDRKPKFKKTLTIKMLDILNYTKFFWKDNFGMAAFDDQGRRLKINEIPDDMLTFVPGFGIHPKSKFKAVWHLLMSCRKN